jgi:hypothetical protein
MLKIPIFCNKYSVENAVPAATLTAFHIFTAMVRTALPLLLLAPVKTQLCEQHSDCLSLSSTAFCDFEKSPSSCAPGVASNTTNDEPSSNRPCNNPNSSMNITLSTDCPFGEICKRLTKKGFENECRKPEDIQSNFFSPIVFTD